MPRRSFKINIVVNSRHIQRVFIDPHYELKHSDSISDSLILELVALLDGGDFTPEVITKGFEYYATDNLVLKDKRYRLVWLFEKDELYIGVVNAYRRKP
jgi:hypothetical protein